MQKGAGPDEGAAQNWESCWRKPEAVPGRCPRLLWNPPFRRTFGNS